MSILEFYDPSRISRIVLDDEGCELAIEAAEDFTAAGYEPHDQLTHGIKAYLFACHLKSTPGILSISEPDTVQLPMNAIEAAMMIRLGQMFLAQNPAEDITHEPLAFDDSVKNI